jgi:hypothetical protein
MKSRKSGDTLKYLSPPGNMPTEKGKWGSFEILETASTEHPQERKTKEIKIIQQKVIL